MLAVMISVVCLVSPALAIPEFKDTVEKYPNGVYTDYWTASGSSEWVISVIQYPTAYPSSHSLRAYARLDKEYGIKSLTTNDFVYENYVSFNVRNRYANRVTLSFAMSLVDGAGNIVATKEFTHSGTSIGQTVFEIVSVGEDVYLYQDGVSLGPINNALYSSNEQYKLQFGFRGNTGLSSTTCYVIIDDISTESCVGINPSWNEFQSTLECSYRIQGLAQHPDHDYTISLVSLTAANAGIINTTTLSNSTYANFITWSIPTLLGENYGLYMVELNMDSTQLDYDIFVYSLSTDPIEYPDALFTAISNVNMNIYDGGMNGGLKYAGTPAYIMTDTGGGLYNVSYSLVNTPYAFTATISSLYGNEYVNATPVTFSSLSNYYSVSLDGSSIGTTDGMTYDYNITDWSNYTIHIFSFTPDLTKPGVYGYVRDLSTNDGIHGAVVTIANDTTSGTLSTDENGYYYYTSGIAVNETYTVSAARSGYTKSDSYSFTTSPSLTSRKDIYLDPIASDGSGIYYSPHYVRFIVTDKYLFERYYGANVTISGTNVTTTMQTTGTDGACGFQMMENIRYAINTVYGSINQTDYIFPTENSYFIVLDATGTSLLPDSQFYEICNITIVKSEVNSSHATITATYNDTGTGTNSVYFELGQTYSNNNTLNVMETSSVGAGNMTYVFTVQDYVGEDYIIKAVIDHDSFGDVEKHYGINFPGSALPFTGNMMVALVVLIFFVVAMQWGKADAHMGAVLICGLGWWFYYLDIFESMGDATNVVIGVGLGLATVYAVLSMINKKRDEGGI
jgi:hypothetical protein